MAVARKTEHWRSVVGYEGLYSVSDRGRVRSEERRVCNHQNGGTRLVRQRILKAHPNARSGYLVVSLYLNTERRVVTVASLVAAAFHGPNPGGMDVRHENGINTDNRATNLLYGTRVENMADARRHGTLARGERHGNARLTDAEAAAIKADPRPSIVIAIEAGISYAHVRALKTGRRRTMPLDKTPTRGAIGRNIKTERAAGKPKKQAVAIALNTARSAGMDIPQKDQNRQSSPAKKGKR
jgi:hypothetical protein